MLSNKKLLLALFLSALILSSCSDKKSADEQAKQNADYENPEFVIQQAKKILGSNVKFAYKGKFDRDSVIEVAAGIEIQNEKDWGIKFILMKMENGRLTQVFQTPVLNGSFRECLVQKIKFPMFGYELIYYNSQDYFLGSGGGEVYSYVVNYTEDKTYYAHLIAEPNKPVSLYLSDNIDVPEIKSFFISNFKRDFPSFKVVSKDVVLKY